MARARNIKPGFFKNELLAELSCETRLLFIGLWTVADREGRFEDRPKRIRAELFPFETFDVDAMLNQLQTEGFIVRYEVDGTRYVEITNFVKHQDPHYREKASVIPPPPGQTNKMLATNVTRNQRLKILERDEYTCRQCGSTEHLCVDHILPITRGGDSSDGNLQVLCFSCNAKKSNRLDGEQSARKRNKHREYSDFDPMMAQSTNNIEANTNQDKRSSPSDSLIPDSLIPDSLIPDSLIPDPLNGKVGGALGVVDASRGSRLPQGPLPPDWLAFCQRERPDLDPERVYAKFHDHWTAQPGKAGRKSDWAATWRNWVRSEKRGPPRAVANQARSAIEQFVKAGHAGS